MLKITLRKGLVGTQEKQRRVIQALGLKKFGSTVEHADSPVIRGMIGKVGHLVTVECCGDAQVAVSNVSTSTSTVASKPAPKEPAVAAVSKKASK